MLRQLGLKQISSIYKMLVPAQIIANLIITFKPYGFDISAPVSPNFSDTQAFNNEVIYELQNGLTSKTIIHPNQIKSINQLYAVTKQELEQAKAILTLEDGVLNLDGKMGEIKTQSVWAKNTLQRFHVYGML